MSDFFRYSHGVIFMVLAAAAVKPKIVYLAVVCKQLAYLIDKVIVIFLRIHFCRAELCRRIIQTDLDVIFSACVCKIAHNIAFAVFPRCVFHGVFRICRRPVCKAVMMLAY